MSFATEAAKSVSDARILVEIHVGDINTQWVNNGAGIWSVDAKNVYSWVDSTLVETGFSAQDFDYIGSVKRGGILLTEASELSGITNNPDHFFYDRDDRMVSVCLTNFDEPSLHIMTINVVRGYSYDEFTPSGSPPGPFQGRLEGTPDISISRDESFYGLLTYGGGSVALTNTDGELDTLGEDKDLYGNPVRIYVGFPSLDYADYQQIYSGTVETFSVSHKQATFGVADARKQLSKPVQEAMTAEAPVPSIVDLLKTHYNFEDTDAFYDLVAKTAATGASNAYEVAFDSTITLNDNSRKPLIETIGDILTSGFLLLEYDPDGLLKFSSPDLDATTSDVTLAADDILNDYTMKYDPGQVVSSVKVGHSVSYTTTETTYLYTRDTDSEASVFAAYKIFREHSVELPLATTAVSVLWAAKFMSAHSVVRGTTDLEMPLSYYGTNVGDAVFTEFVRPTKTMIGTVMTQIMSKSWNLQGVPSIKFGVRLLEG
jgi:hypothetical protein